MMEPASVSFRSDISAKCCSCSCSCTLVNNKPITWTRSVKRKFDQVDSFSVNFPIPSFDYFSIARVEAENECDALREALNSQQKTIQDLYTELDEERNASSSAANEAMSMMLRLQSEKAEIEMEARQFRRFAEEKIAHDQEELNELDDLLYRHEETIKALSYEVQVYKHRMLSYGLTEAEVEGETIYTQNEDQNQDQNPDVVEKCDYSQSQAENYDTEYEFPPYDYPPLRCNLNENQSPHSEATDFEKYPFGETPRSAFSDSSRCSRARDVHDLENSMYQFERNPSNNQLDREYPVTKNVFEKSVFGQSPRRSRHVRRYSVDSCASFLESIRETSDDSKREAPRSSFKKLDFFSQPQEHSNLRKVENASDFGDEMSDRVYTVDSVNPGEPNNSFAEREYGTGKCDDCITTPRESLRKGYRGDPDIQKLYMKLQELEADRESMKQAIMSMRTDRAQLILLREIAQNLCNEMSPERRMSLNKPSLLGKLSLKSALKCAVSLVSWKKKSRRSKYMFGKSASNAGLRYLLEKDPYMKLWRCPRSTKVALNRGV